jgi:ankyrin repeat protein
MEFLSIVLGFAIIAMIIAIYSFIKRKIQFAAGKITETPLMNAAIAGDVIAINELLSSGVDINATNAINNTALSLAVIKKKEEAVKILIDAGADLSKWYSEKKNIFDLAIESKNERILLNLIEKADTELLAKSSLLRTAAKENFGTNILKKLLEKDKTGIYKIRRSDYYSDIDMALQFATENTNIQSIELLLENGASLETRPIWEATEKGSLSLVKKFIGLGDSVETKKEYAGDKLTCLALAVSRGYYEIAELLLENNANPNALIVNTIYGSKKPLLQWAAEKNYNTYKTMKPLLEKYGGTY